MGTYVFETPMGKKLRIQSDNPDDAQKLADQWIDDTDAVVRTTYGEARSDPDSQAGVASVILNRSNATGKRPRDVVMEKGQFEPWGDPKTREGLEALDPQSPEYQDIMKRVAPVLGGEDVTNGATHFYAPKAQAALGRAAPKWDDGTGVDMGAHRFFSRPGDFQQPPQPTVEASVVGRPDLGTGAAYKRGFAPGMVERGNLDPNQRKVLHNPGGGYSTTSSISIGTDQGEVLIPTVVDGVRLSQEDAKKHFFETGEHFGVFKTPDDADRYATALHNRQDQYVQSHGGPDKFRPRTPASGPAITAALDGRTAPRKSQLLGLQKGAVKPLDNLAVALEAGLGRLGVPVEQINEWLGMPSASEAKADHAAAVAAAKARGVVPGLIGENGGMMLGTLPAAMLPGGLLVQGAASGAALTDAATPQGVAGDAALGAIGGKLGGLAVKGASSALGKLLGKLPPIRTPAALAAAKDAAYAAVDNSGVAYKPSTFSGLITAMGQDVRAANFNPLLHPKVAGALDQLEKLKGRAPSLTEVDQLRQFIRDNVVDGATAGEKRLGQMMVREIDHFISGTGPKQVIAGDPKVAAVAIKTARDLNTRLMKTKDVATALDDAGLRAGSTGSGGNVDNASRQNMRRVLKKAHSLTPDEDAALRKVIMGGRGQNALRQVGKLSPQGNGLMTALGIGGAMTNPVLGIPSLVGSVSKVVADGMTKRNIDELLRIIAAGGSKAALKPIVPASVQAVQKAILKARAPVAAATVATTSGQ